MSDSDIERFWSKVEAIPGICWQWTGVPTTTGSYGSFSIRGKLYKAHRVAYSLLIGDTALELDHLCRNRLCVNPDHLQPVTTQINVLRGYNPAGLQARKTHCKRGHAFTPENTIWKANGKWRKCRACHIADYKARSILRGRQRRQERERMLAASPSGERV